MEFRIFFNEPEFCCDLVIDEYLPSPSNPGITVVNSIIYPVEG